MHALVYTYKYWFFYEFASQDNRQAAFLKNFLSEYFGDSIALHSGLSDIHEREQSIERMCRGDAKILLTTELLATAMDITNARICVIYHLNRQDGQLRPHMFLAMCGRVGRFGGEGVVTTLMSEDEFAELPAFPIANTQIIEL